MQGARREATLDGIGSAHLARLPLPPACPPAKRRLVRAGNFDLRSRDGKQVLRAMHSGPRPLCSHSPDRERLFQAPRKKSGKPGAGWPDACVFCAGNQGTSVPPAVEAMPGEESRSPSPGLSEEDGASAPSLGAGELAGFFFFKTRWVINPAASRVRTVAVRGMRESFQKVAPGARPESRRRRFGIGGEGGALGLRALWERPPQPWQFRGLVRCPVNNGQWNRF